MRRRTMVRVLGLAAWVYGALVIGSPAAEEQLGKVHFPVSCSPAAQAQFDRAMALLHSFFYPETVKAFTAITQTEPGCAMAYWGLAMSIRQNPLIPVNIATLKQGGEAIEKAKATSAATPRERDWIAALDTYYRDLDTVDHKTRVLAYEKAMEHLSLRYRDDSEATIFYALALNEATELADKTYARQLKAGALLEQVFAQQPDHPGVAHYIIHSYDYGPLAVRALPAARHYAAIAPSASHALHMPSHIFSMLGLWHDVVTSNRAAEAATKAYAAKHLTGETRWLHAQDFRIHAHLQLAQDQEARRIVDERHTIEKPLPVRLPTETAFAAIPVRYAIERGHWAEAAALEPRGLSFPQAEAIVYFGRVLGAARGGDLASARRDVDKLQTLRDALSHAKNAYWAEQVEIQRQAATAWVARAEGRHAEAVGAMRSAAELEDASEKHIAMENRLVPMRELLGELLLEVNDPAAALIEFEASLQRVPNRFRSFSGAARAAELAGDREQAKTFYAKLVALADQADTDRPELVYARAFLAK
jgi:tetratricopeptide (TPR) repeat protein